MPLALDTPLVNASPNRAAADLATLSDGHSHMQRHRGVLPDESEFSWPSPRPADAAPDSAEPIERLWPPAIVLGYLSLLCGAHVGKGFLAMDLCARASRGLPWPVQPDTAARTPTHAIVCPGDALTAGLIEPRLEAAGARREWIRVLPLAAPRKSSHLGFDLEAIERALDAFPDGALVVLDPVTVGLSRGGGLSPASQRFLALLGDLARRRGAAVLAIIPVPNDYASAPDNRFLGAIASSSAAFAAFAVLRDKESDLRYMVPIRSVSADDSSSLAFAIRANPQDRAAAAAHVQWIDDPLDSREAAAAAGAAPQRLQGEAISKAMDWLVRNLRNGPVPVQQLKRLAERDKHAWRTVQRAKVELSVGDRKVVYEGTTYSEWRLLTEALNDGRIPTDASKEDLRGLIVRQLEPLASQTALGGEPAGSECAVTRKIPTNGATLPTSPTSPTGAHFRNDDLDEG